jgi:cytochrome c oxidase subunit IV
MYVHILPVKVYVTVFLALIVLTAATTAIAYLDLGIFNGVVALAIAGIKMLLVMLFFMHLKYSPRLTHLVIMAAFFWLALLITFTLSDELTRGWTPAPQSWGPAIAAPAPRMQ